MRGFSVSSLLEAPPDEVWRHATSAEGVNLELRPLLRMTFPTSQDSLTESWAPGERLGRSWLLLGGLLPIDYDDVTFVEVEPGRRFLERSPLLSQRVWEHERRIEPAAEGCRVTDRIAFEPRLSLLAPLYAPVFRWIFRRRHLNLRRRFGGREASC